MANTSTSSGKNSPITEKLDVGFEFDPEMDEKIREKIINARVRLLMKEPFFGTLAIKMKLINADKWCPTAATDGRHFYYNTKFLESLTIKQTQFVLGHEVLHCVYDHLGRWGSRDPQLSNIASDYCVNQDLIKHDIGERPKQIPILHDQKYDGWTFEQVYDDLWENRKQLDLEQLCSMVLDEHMDGNNGSDDSDGDGQTEPDGTCPKCGNKPEDANENGDGGKEKCDHPCHQPGNNGRPRPLTQEEKEQIRDDFRQSVLASANAINDAGNIPAGVKRLIGDLTESKMDWRELLDLQIKSMVKSDFSWKRPNRKTQHTGFIFPGMNNAEMIDIVVALDTSGSVDDDMLKDFMSEIKGIMEQYAEFKIKVMCFDTKIYNVRDYTADTMYDFIEDYVPDGRGGTAFGAVYNYLEKEGIEPLRLVFFTDGYPCDRWPEDAPAYDDTVFIIHTDNMNNPPVPPGNSSYAYYDRTVKGGVQPPI